jgi:camphor 5-monooxygenase
MVYATQDETPANVPQSSIIDFDIYQPPGLAKDFHSAWATLLDEKLPEMVWTPRNGGHWMPTRAALVARLLTDHELLSSRVMQVPRERSVGNRPIPGSMDPPSHTPFHTLVVSAFSPARIRGLEGKVRDLAVSLIEGMKAKGGCEFVAEFAIQLPLRIFIGYAGLPVADLPMLRELAEEKVRPTGKISAAEVMKSLSAYLDPHVRERTATPGDDLISLLVNSPIEGRQMTHDEAIRLCSQVLVAGLDTIASMLSFTILYLARNPDLRRRLASNKADVPKAVEEFLRRFPLVAIAREARREADIGGVHVNAGDLIVLPTMLYGLDEGLFPNATDIDLGRKPGSHLTFGTGVHRCPGAPLARLEMRIVLEEWLSRIPEFTVDEGQDFRYKSGVVGTVSNLPLRWTPTP